MGESGFYNSPEEADVRIHGNGFMQAELPDGRKMHVWNKGDPDFPKQDVSTQVHNHVSSFRSTIIHGRLKNIEYQMKPIDDIKRAGGRFFSEYEARVRHDKDTGLYPTGREFGIGATRVFNFSVGSSYDFPGASWLFHETVPDTNLVITFVERTSKNDTSRNPIIMVPLGSEPDNEFDRYAHQDYAYELYAQVINFLKR